MHFYAAVVFCARLSHPAPYQRNFLFIALVLVGRFENERPTLQKRVPHNVAERFRAYMALADFVVSVLMRIAAVHAVVEMYRVKLVKPDYAVKFGQNSVKVVFDVVAAVPCMARVKAYAKLLGDVCALDNRLQLLEISAYLAALAGHRFKQHYGVHVRTQHAVKRVRDKLDASFNALPHMAAGMEIVVVARQVLHALDVVLQHID